MTRIEDRKLQPETLLRSVGVAFFATGSCSPVQLEKLKLGVFRNR